MRTTGYGARSSGREEKAQASLLGGRGNAVPRWAASTISFRREAVTSEIDYVRCHSRRGGLRVKRIDRVWRVSPVGPL